MKLYKMILRDRIIGAYSDLDLTALDGYHETPWAELPEAFEIMEVADYFFDKYPELFRKCPHCEIIEFTQS